MTIINGTANSVYNDANVTALLEGAGLLGTSEGMALIVHINESKRMANAMNDSLTRIQNAGRVRDAINAQIQRASKAIAEIKKLEPKGNPPITTTIKKILEKVYGLREKPSDQSPLLIQPRADSSGFVQPLTQQQRMENAKIQREWEKNKSDWAKEHQAALNRATEEFVLDGRSFDFDEQSGKVVTVEGKPIAGGLSDDTKISTEDIDAYKQALGNDSKKLDSQREVQMTLFQGYMGRKQQLMTLLSNVMKKANETQSRIANNI